MNSFESFDEFEPAPRWTPESLIEAAKANGFKPRQELNRTQRLTAEELAAELCRTAIRPKPLLPDLEAAKPYPLEALPPLMCEAAKAIIEHVQAPSALAGQCVIGAAVYLAQSRVNAPALHSPKGMPCSMFQLTLADSGDRKSACRQLAFKTIDEREARCRADHAQACKEITNMASGLKGKQFEQFMAEHPLPVDPRTQYSDATFERITGDMIRGASAVTLDTDEGGQVLGGASLKADTRAAVLGGLVKGFDNGAFERTRSLGNAEGSGFAYNRRLSIHLLAQRVAVESALNDPLLQGQGFLARFLFTSAESLAGSRFLTLEQLERKAYSDRRLQRFWERCEAISATPEAIDKDTGEVLPPVLELNAEALSEWLDFYNEVEGEQSDFGQFVNLRPFAGRAGELVRRLAAVFACFEGHQQIDGDCLSRAAVMVRHSLNEWARYMNVERVNPDLQSAAALIRWMLDPKRVDSWRMFDKGKAGKSWPPAMRNAKKRNHLLAILIEHGYLFTRDGHTFLINPLAESAETAENL